MDCLLDTNIVSAHPRGDQRVGDQILANSALYLPVTVLGELFYGAHHSEHRDKQLRRIQAFPPLVRILEVTAPVAEYYGQLKAHLASRGSIIPENDLWIAAVCLVNDLTLATRDAHFENKLWCQAWHAWMVSRSQKGRANLPGTR